MMMYQMLQQVTSSGIALRNMPRLVCAPCWGEMFPSGHVHCPTEAHGRVMAPLAEVLATTGAKQAMAIPLYDLHALWQNTGLFQAAQARTMEMMARNTGTRVSASATAKNRGAYESQFL
jgi:hypothetical protein